MLNKQRTAVAKNDILAQGHKLNTAIIITSACDIKQTDLFVERYIVEKCVGRTGRGNKNKTNAKVNKRLLRKNHKG